MDQPRKIPSVPYVPGDTPPWSPGFEEPGRTPEEQAARRELDAEEQLRQDEEAKEDVTE